MKPIPVFPEKRPIALEDKDLFDNIFKKYPPVISEYSFTNLFAWRNAYQFSISMLEDFLLVVSDKGNAWQVFDPIGPISNKKEIILKCLNFFKSGKEMAFVRLPEATKALFDGSKESRIEEDRNNFDYLYLASDLIGLKGAGFDGKRNFMKRFKETYSFSYKKLNKESMQECLSFEKEWCLAKDCQNTAGLDKETEALDEMLKNFQYLRICGGMIEVGGKVEAVSLGEALNLETFVVHVEKANGRLVGIYQTINQMFCSHEASNYKYVNREQDLGVSGLRQAKESYHPCAMVKKYTLIKNEK